MMTRCPTCGTQNRPNTPRCITCDAALQPATTEVSDEPRYDWQALMPQTLADKIRSAAGDAYGERREVTALCIDIRGFDDAPDLETAYLMSDEVLRLLANVVFEFEGIIDSADERGMLALFGTPVTHENDPERAIRAVLAMQTRLHPLLERLENRLGLVVSVRMGIHTGLVIVGTTGGNWQMEYTVVGDTVNLAQTLAQSAENNAALVSPIVYQRTRPIFRFQTMTTAAEKAYRPLGLRYKPGRVRGLPGLQVPMVGRQEPLAQLHQALTHAVDARQTQVVLTTGDAGVGKSRLLHELRATVGQNQPDVVVYEGSCQTYARSRPYWIITELVRNMLGLSDSATPSHQIAELTTYVQNVGLTPATTVPYLAHLLGLGKADADIEARLHFFDAAMLQKLTYAAVRQLILAEAAIAPVILIFEDLHWADSASWDFLLYLIQSTGDAALLLLLVSRRDHQERLEQLTKMTATHTSPLTHIQLDRLTSAESRQLVNRLIPLGHDQARQLKEQIATRADGNPFFTEEIVRMLMDEEGLVQRSGQWAIMPSAFALLKKIPGTLQGLILARFDSLQKPVQHTLQKAAILGVSFPARLIMRLNSLAPELVHHHLEHLVARQFLAVDDQWGTDDGYVFQHALVQEAIYGTLLKRRRQQLHRQVAQVIEQNPRWLADERTEMLAYHYHQGGQPDQAIPYMLAAAENASEHFANETAVHYFRQALALVDERQTTASAAYFRAAGGLGRALKWLGKYGEASEVLNQSLQQMTALPSEMQPDDALFLRVEGLRELADIRQREGAYEEAVALLEKTLTVLSQTTHQRQPVLYRGVIERLVFIRFRQGQLDEALALAQTVTEDASLDEAPDPVTLANLYNHLGGISWQQGNSKSAIFYVEQSLQLNRQLGYTWGIANAYSNLGVLHAQSGRWTEAVESLERALQLREAIGDVPSQGISLANLGQLRYSLGEHAAARQDVNQALSISRRLGDQYQMAKLYVILAQLDLVEDQPAQALTHVQRALGMADEIGSHDIRIEGRWVLALVQQKDNIPVALETVNQGLVIAKSAGLMDGEADCLRVLGMISTQVGDYVKAETSLRESAELFRQINDPYRHGLTLIALGELYQKLAQTDAPEWHTKAQEAYAQAVEQLGAVEAAHDLQRAEAALAQLEHDAAVRQNKAVSRSSTASWAQAERRTAAILWLKIGLPPETDDETAFEIMSFTLPTCATIIQEYTGVARQQPDGLMAVFGAPVAYEDDAERAVLAAYHILEHLQQEQAAGETPLTVQIAVSYGPVIASQIQHQHYSELVVQGAPRRQAQDAVGVTRFGAISVTETVRAATEHRFAYRSAPFSVAFPLPLWEVTGLRAQPGPARGLAGVHTRFIGRDVPLQAMHQLAGCLDRRMGGIIWIEGEAGIGKSRLMREFRSTIVAANEEVVWSGGCAPQRANNAFSLFSDLMAQVIGIQPADTPDQIQHKLETVVQSWPADAQRTRPYLEMLIGLRPSGLEGARLNRLEPEQLRHQTFVALRRLLKTLAKRQPLILLLDDLHWIDPISAELLIFIATMVTSDPILFVCAQRREGADLPNDRLVRLHSLLKGQTTRLVLNRLSSEDSQTLLGELLPGAKLPDGLRRIIIDRAEGNPYFIEEFVRMFIEQGYVKYLDNRWQVTMTDEQIEAPLPYSLETLIRSRVDALPSDLKQVLQSAAIIGHEFEADLLEAIAAVPNVPRALERLASRLMLQATADPNHWQFSHNIFISVVYNTMLRKHRQALHLKVAQILEARWSDARTEHAEVLAYHFTQANETVQALPYLITAGEQAASRYANEEAIVYFQQAADFLAQLPEPNGSWQWRIAIGLGDVYRFVGNYSASAAALSDGIPLTETDQYFRDRRANLYRRLGETARKQGDFDMAERHFMLAQAQLSQPQTAPLQIEAARTLHDLAWVFFGQGQFDQALQACEDSLAYARQADSLNELALAENLLGGIYYHLGEWRSALQHTTRAMVLREQMGYSWGVAATLSNLGILAFVAGYWSKAISFFERSLELRQEMGDVEGVSITHNNLGNAYRGLGELTLAENHFRRSIETATTFSMSYHIANGSVGLAQVLLWGDQLDESARLLADSVKHAEMIGAQDVLAETYRVQAELLLHHRRCQDALDMAHKASALAATIGNRAYEAAGWRVSAAAALGQGNLVEAQRFIDKARDALAEATDELEVGQVASQAYRVYRAAGLLEQAEAEKHAARTIFTRLGAAFFLEQLEKQ